MTPWRSDAPVASPCLGKALFCDAVASASPLVAPTNLTLLLPFVLPDVALEMLVAGAALGEALLAGVDQFVNDAMPPALLAALGGAVTWAPALTEAREFNSTPAATAALLYKRLNATAAEGGVSTVNVTAFGEFGLVEQRNWTGPADPSTALAVVARRRAALRPAAAAAASGAPRRARALALAAPAAFNASNATGCRAAGATVNSTVVALFVLLTPPQTLVNAMGFTSAGELAALINAALSIPSAPLAVVSAAAANCSRSNLSAVFAAGAGSVAKRYAVGPSASPNATAALYAALEDFAGPEVSSSLALAGVACCCAAATGLLRRRWRRQRKAEAEAGEEEEKKEEEEEEGEEEETGGGDEVKLADGAALPIDLLLPLALPLPRRTLAVLYHPSAGEGAAARFARAIAAAAGAGGALSGWAAWAAPADEAAGGASPRRTPSRARAAALAAADATLLVWGPPPADEMAAPQLTQRLALFSLASGSGAAGGASGAALGAARARCAAAAARAAAAGAPPLATSALEYPALDDVFGEWAAGCVAPTLPALGAPRGAALLADLGAPPPPPRVLAVLFHPPSPAGAAAAAAAALVAEAAPGGALAGWLARAAPLERAAPGGRDPRAAADVALYILGGEGGEGGEAAARASLVVHVLGAGAAGLRGAPALLGCLAARGPLRAVPLFAKRRRAQSAGGAPVAPAAVGAWAAALLAPALPPRGRACLLADLRPLRTLAVLFFPPAGAPAALAATLVAEAAPGGALAGWHARAAPLTGGGGAPPPEGAGGGVAAAAGARAAGAPAGLAGLLSHAAIHSAWQAAADVVLFVAGEAGGEGGRAAAEGALSVRWLGAAARGAGSYGELLREVNAPPPAGVPPPTAESAPPRGGGAAAWAAARVAGALPALGRAVLLADLRAPPPAAPPSPSAVALALLHAQAARAAL
jgi:hypothetical protein